MSLYDRAVDLQVKLEAAQAADASIELLTKGARLVDSLERASTYFAHATAFRVKAHLNERPSVDLKTVTQAVGGFRAGLSRHGSAAFQHQPATTLAEVAKAQRERTARWVAAQWHELFAPYDPLLERVRTERLVGNATHVVVAQARASKLRAAKSLDPVANATELRTGLGGDDVEAWLIGIGKLAADLGDALSALDAEQAAFTPEVREALRRAADEGFPLSDLSDELLTALRNAGVDGHLLVRSQ
jgi:hypothetical protein